MASQLRVDEIIASTGSSVAIGTAGGSVTLAGDFTVDTSKGLNVGTGATIFSPSSNVLTLGTNSAERVRITSTGSVGIGTDNPVNRFHATQYTANTDVATFQIGSASAYTGFVNCRVGTTGAGSFIGGLYTPDGSLEGLQGTNGLIFSTSGSNLERLRINSNGTVGINTTADIRQLEIYNSSHATAALKSDTQSSLFFSDDDTNIGQISYMHSGNYMYFRVNDEERLRITSDGKIGINSTSPLEIVDIVHNAPKINATATNGSSGFRLNVASGYGNQTFRVQEGGTTVFTIQNGGDILIPNGKGIDFSASGIEASGTITNTNQLLDDYEEGLWTPTLTGSTSGSASGYSHQKAGYVKIGNVVHVYGYLLISNKGTITGNVRISNFPFAAKNTSLYYHAPAFGWYTAMTGITAYGLGLDMAPGQTSHTIVYGSGTTVASLAAGNINNNFGVEWAFTYRTD